MAEKRLAGTRVLMVIAQDQFRDEELFVPKKLLEEAGAEVKVASGQLQEAIGMLGGTYKPEALLANCQSADFAGIVVVGGMGSPQYLWSDDHLHRILKEMHKEGKVLAAICLSGAVLGLAGVIEGKKATVWPMPESLAALKDGNATYLKEPVVQDGRIITADGPEACEAFAKAVIVELSKVKV